MSLGEKMWPQKYGFKIVGNGPTFIVSVEAGSEAEESGLVPGDRLMELDGYDISRLSADVLTILMKETKGYPPAVGVVPSVCPIYLTCNKLQRCGFNITTKKPITVSHVEPTGIAFAAGLRKGDIILTVNNKVINEFGHKELLLIAENESLVLSTIPTGIRENTITDDFRGPQIKTSKFLFTKVSKCCCKDYHKKMALVGALTEYSEDWDIYSLCTSLDNLLKEPSDRKLLKHIEPFIPRHQKDVFKPLLKKKKLHKDCQHLAYIPNKPAQKLNFRILRGNNPYGFVIKGSCPIHVEWLDPGGPAEFAGLLPGDFIVAVNDIDTRNFSHEQVIKLLQFCGPVPTVDVERYEDAIHEVGINTSFDTLSNISSTINVESFNWICNEFSNVTDAEGWAFKEKMEYLLTPRERAQLEMDFLQYVNSRNIVKLYRKLEPILDSPSRRTLWQFLLTKMSKSHQEYIHLKENVYETPQNKSTKNLLEYYLNSKEETKMKDALDLYLKNRGFEQVKIMERILNTAAKEELWSGILPHLIPEHTYIIQKESKERKKIFANFHRGIGFKRPSNIYLPPSSESNWEGNDSEEEFKLLEAAVDSVQISNDWLLPNLSSEDDSPSINDISTLSGAPGSHGNSTSACSSYLSKTPTIFSPYDFTQSISLQRKIGDTQSLVLAYDRHDQIPRNRFVPQKSKRKTVMTSNGILDYKLSSEDLQSTYGSYPSVYSQKAPSLPNMYPMSTMGEDFETKRSLHLPEQQISSQQISSQPISSQLISSQLISSQPISSQLISSQLISSQLISSQPISSQQISSQLVQTRKEAKNPQNDPKQLSSPVNELKSVSIVNVTSGSYYDEENDDDDDDDDGSKNRMIPVQNETVLDHRMTLQNEEQYQFKTRKEAKNPQNDPKQLSSVNELKSVSIVNVTSESYYDEENDDDDDDDGSKNRMIPVQNETVLDHRMTLQNEEQYQSKTRKEAKNPQNDPKQLSSPVNELKSVSIVNVTSESYYDEENDDDDDGSKNGMIPVQNETVLDHRMTLQNEEQYQSKTDKKSPAHNSHDMTPAFTYGNANNCYAELTTFGKVKNKINLASSKDRNTPGIPEDKMEDTNKFGHTVINISGTQGPSKITHYRPAPIYKSTEDGNHLTTIPIKVNDDNDSFVVHEQLNHQTPMITEELKKINARTSAFQPYQKDVRKNIQPQGDSYSGNGQESSPEDIAETSYTYSERSAGNISHQVNDVHEKPLIAQKPQRLKNGRSMITADRGAAPIVNLDREAVMFNQNRSSDKHKMNLKARNPVLGIGLESDSRRKKCSSVSDLAGWYLSQVRNQSSKTEDQTEYLSKAKEKFLNSRFRKNGHDDKEECYSEPTIDTNVSVMEKIKELEAQKNIPSKNK